MTPRPLASDFRCLHCGNHISILQITSGVHNRNHCPICLWSRHLDLAAAGDRLSACKAPMRPLGLTMKPGHNKYAPGGGELMLVHLCFDCGRLSINRIAADDDVQALLEIFTASFMLPARAREGLLASGICLLDQQDVGNVRRQLLGNGSILAA
ncbi:MAG: RNHCP domain-containing protein [Chloroflexota bacterium]